MNNYICADTAADKTKIIRSLNKKKIKEYELIGERIVFPTLMAQIMKGIEEAISIGEGELVYKCNLEQFIAYNTIAIETGFELVENKMSVLGYRIIQMDGYTYKFIWLSNKFDF